MAKHPCQPAIQTAAMAAMTVLAAVMGLGHGPAEAWSADPATCAEVELANVGWTDISATTGMATVILEGLGYEPQVTIASVPITFQALASGDMDVFFGLWMPTMTTMIEPFFVEGGIDQVQTNLEGAKYTLAVTGPGTEGVESLADLAGSADLFGRMIFGIEPGNDGNALITQMIVEDAFGLGDWTLVESSEQGMLVEVGRRAREGRASVFLGWEPHPMNERLDITYLAGGDDWFGPNFGGATVYTLTRAGYSADCPNVGMLLENLVFSLEMENILMDYILNQDMQPETAATRYLLDHPEVLERFLANVQTLSGGSGLPAVRTALGF